MDPTPPYIPKPVPRPSPTSPQSHPQFPHPTQQPEQTHTPTHPSQPPHPHPPVNPYPHQPDPSIPLRPSIYPTSRPAPHTPPNSTPPTPSPDPQTQPHPPNTPTTPDPSFSTHPSPTPSTSQPATSPDRPTPPPQQDGSSNLDKIRELIFGDEIRRIENRILQLESKFTQEINHLKALFDEHYKSLDRATLILAQETRDRIESLTARAQQEQARIGEQIRQQHNTLYDMLAKATNDLRNDKADRRLIAEMFSEMAKRLLNTSASPSPQTQPRYENPPHP
ncbi:MAG: hypothetical protein NZM04_07225 [Methylacidiphilales bacterium]|nr:hypothetical protein [Candidatus Methylacidiphilales bacterium]MDW8349243.1 hypothetical protein [Verrucomicrobiae bacterium]